MTLTTLHQRPATSSWWCSPLPNGDGSKWQDRSPEGFDQKVAPLPRTVISLGCPLTDHNWAAPLLIDRTLLRRILNLALLLISGSVPPNPGPISNHPCSICHLDVGRDSLQCSICLKWVHFLCSSLSRTDFCTICATGTAVGWRCLACCPKAKLATHSDQFPCYDVCVPSTRVLPTTTWLLSTTFTSGPPHYPCSMCSHEVGKDSLKYSTCSKWVHFCSFLTQANFCKICAAGSTMGWNCPACLNGDLASPTHQQVSPRPVSPALPPPTPHPPPTCSHLMD